jgi:hypothetical protein
MTDDTTVLDRAGPENTDWRLVRTADDELEARKTIPYDGVRTYSTASRGYVSYRKSSRYNLDACDVLELYADATGRNPDVPTTVRDAIVERLDAADDPLGHADLVYYAEYEDGFQMGDVEDTIDDLVDDDTIRDVAPEREGPAYEVTI